MTLNYFFLPSFNIHQQIFIEHLGWKRETSEDTFLKIKLPDWVIGRLSSRQGLS